MSQIVCARCGEPWDSSGGLHHTHSDLVASDYKALLRGRGCLCCGENIGYAADREYTPENIVAWQKSIEHLSEGDPVYMYFTFNIRPIRVDGSTVK